MNELVSIGAHLNHVVEPCEECHKRKVSSKESNESKLENDFVVIVKCPSIDVLLVVRHSRFNLKPSQVQVRLILKGIWSQTRSLNTEVNGNMSGCPANLALVAQSVFDIHDNLWHYNLHGISNENLDSKQRE